MFQDARNVKINGGSFTVVNEQNGMTGVFYRFVVNSYLLTATYSKVFRYCIDGFQTAPPMTLPNMHPHVTQIPARLSLLTLWTG